MTKCSEFAEHSQCAAKGGEGVS